MGCEYRHLQVFGTGGGYNEGRYINLITSLNTMHPFRIASLLQQLERVNTVSLNVKAINSNLETVSQLNR